MVVVNKIIVTPGGFYTEVINKDSINYSTGVYIIGGRFFYIDGIMKEQIHTISELNSIFTRIRRINKIDGLI